MSHDDHRDEGAPAGQPPLQWPSHPTTGTGQAANGPDAWSAPGSSSDAVPAPGAAAPPGYTPGPHGPTPPPGAHGQVPPQAAAPSFRSWQPGIIPLRPLSFGDFLTVPFKAMRFNRAVVLGAPLLFTLISTILMLVALWMLFTDPQLGLMSAIPSLSGISGATVTMLVVSVLMMLLADVFSSAIIAPGVARAVLGERIGIPVAWRQLRRRLGSLLLLYLLSAAALTLIIVVGFAPFLFSLISGDASGVALVGSVLLALLLLVPAGLFVAVVQGIARAMIVLEGISMVAALKRLSRLIRGRFWWSILILFVTSILINIVASVLQYAGQFASIGVTLFAPENMTVLLIAFFVIFGITYVVSIVLVYSYLGSVFSLMYIDLRMRREGFDLDLARAAEERARR